MEPLAYSIKIKLEPDVATSSGIGALARSSPWRRPEVGAAKLDEAGSLFMIEAGDVRFGSLNNGHRPLVLLGPEWIKRIPHVECHDAEASPKDRQGQQFQTHRHFTLLSASGR
jgi:hypothetical protein